MKCVVYVSRATEAFEERALSELSELAATSNVERDISGYLYYDQGHFTQYFEGENESVDRLLATIEQDPRHSILTSSTDEKLAQRRFTHWSMRRLLQEEFIAIQLEHVLTDHLLFVSRIPTTEVLAPQSLWRMVDALAKFQARLVS